MHGESLITSTELSSKLTLTTVPVLSDISIIITSSISLKRIILALDGKESDVSVRKQLTDKILMRLRTA